MRFWVTELLRPALWAPVAAGGILLVGWAATSMGDQARGLLMFVAAVFALVALALAEHTLSNLLLGASPACIGVAGYYFFPLRSSEIVVVVITASFIVLAFDLGFGVAKLASAAHLAAPQLAGFRKAFLHSQVTFSAGAIALFCSAVPYAAYSYGDVGLILASGTLVIALNLLPVLGYRDALEETVGYLDKYAKAHSWKMRAVVLLAALATLSASKPDTTELRLILRTLDGWHGLHFLIRVYLQALAGAVMVVAVVLAQVRTVAAVKGLATAATKAVNTSELDAVLQEMNDDAP